VTLYLAYLLLLKTIRSLVERTQRSGVRFYPWIILWDAGRRGETIESRVLRYAVQGTTFAHSFAGAAGLGWMALTMLRFGWSVVLEFSIAAVCFLITAALGCSALREISLIRRGSERVVASARSDSDIGGN
jgi:hypothetical protein